MVKNLELVVYYNFGAEDFFFLILAPKTFFFSQFKAPKTLFIINFGAKGAFYCQRRFVNTLCIVGRVGLVLVNWF